MADPAAIRGALDRIGFSAVARNYIVNDQGIDAVEEFRILSDEEVENLCKNVRRPGGTIPNPNNGQGQPENIPNPGIPVSMRAESNLKLMCYYIRHKDRTSRSAYIPGITSASIRALRHLRDEEKAHKDPEDTPSIGRDWAKNMEGIEEWLRRYIGVTGVPLSYVIRKEPNVRPTAQDPPGNYESHIEEMIARSPIRTGGTYNPYFVTDNKKVWDLLCSILRDHECWSYIKGYQRTHDGRRAFESLFNHYLGPNTIDNQAAEAEKTLLSLTYKGESKRWNFEKYVTAHKQQHQVLEGLMSQGYIGIDERAKVRHLMAGIKDPNLRIIKSQILSSAEHRNNFDMAVTLYKDFIIQDASDKTPTYQIAAVGSYNTASKNESGNQEIEDRYHTKQEYQKLTRSQREKLRNIRQSRGRNSTNDRRKSGKGDRSDRPTNKRFKRQIAAIVAEILQDNHGDNHQDPEVTPNPNSNRNHPALTRQSQGPQRK